MADSHDRFDEQAVGHVLGGLSSDDAATFRSHLLGCPVCRARVTELRTLAGDLEAAAREERAAQRLRVASEPRVEKAAPDTAVTADDRRQRWLVMAAVVGLAVAGLLVVWNQALRLDNATLAGVTAAREDVLATLGDGMPMAVETRAGVTGVAALDESSDTVAISLAGLVDLAATNRVVVWRGEGSGRTTWERHLTLDPQRLVDGRLALVVPVTDVTTTVEVTVEPDLVPETPNEFPVFRVALDD